MANPAPLIRDRLKAEIPELREVRGALDLAAIRGSLVRFPAAFVFLAADSATPNTRAVGAFVQNVTADVAVVLCVKGANDPTGEKTSDELEDLQAQVRTALIGWEPGNGFEPLGLRQGKMLGFKEGVAFWQDTYQARDEFRA
ncbi:phage tail terminator protein [Thalassospira marina]|uniref:Uncharacterized protein n=1 Tax=Thalassospira marina TaxID=2048283 RepID=A0ABM6QBQ7_9PROT|nr:hypothetical protein [Thalassospira marina]AUG53937.1 hypothetical protein CSC3H3_15335 [Thalassospira marina]